MNVSMRQIKIINLHLNSEGSLISIEITYKMHFMGKSRSSPSGSDSLNFILILIFEFQRNYTSNRRVIYS